MYLPPPSPAHPASSLSSSESSWSFPSIPTVTEWPLTCPLASLHLFTTWTELRLLQDDYTGEGLRLTFWRSSATWDAMLSRSFDPWKSFDVLFEVCRLLRRPHVWYFMVGSRLGRTCPGWLHSSVPVPTTSLRVTAHRKVLYVSLQESTPTHWHYTTFKEWLLSHSIWSRYIPKIIRHEECHHATHLFESAVSYHNCGVRSRRRSTQEQYGGPIPQITTRS